MSPLLSLRGLDSQLAARLLAEQRVDYANLHEALTRVRRLRSTHPSQTLALELVERGLLAAHEVERALAELAGHSELLRSWELGAQHAELEILKPLGAGGMGEVFLARELATGAEVAVKTVPLGEDADLLERFQREAEAQARVGAHPHIVKVRRSGVAGGRLFLVMDLVRGGDLAARLEQGPLAPLDAARLVRQLGLGLAFAHERQVLHRDLKPANVLFDEAGAPRLADFGLARLLDARTLTQTGQTLGTPSYMAPEQALGQPQDARTDVYGLGGLLYAALTASPPYQAGGVLATLDLVLNQAPPDPRDLTPATPARLAEICLRCLQKSPVDRYASVAEVTDELQTFLANPESPSSRSWLLPAALGLLGFALALALALSSTFVGGAPPRPAAEASRPSPAPQARLPKIPEGQARRLVTQAGNGLEGAALAERCLAQGLGPRRWLQERCAEPFVAIDAKHVVHCLPLGATRLLCLASLHDEPHMNRFTAHDARSGELLKAWTATDARVSPAGKTLALFAGKEVRWIEVGSWRELARLPTATRFHKLLTLDEQGQLWAADSTGLLRLDLTTGRSARPSIPLVDPHHGLLLPAGRGLIATAGGKRSQSNVYGLDSKGEILWSCVQALDGKPSAIALQPGEPRVAVGTSTGKIHVFSTESAPGGRRRPILSLGEPDPLGNPRAHSTGVNSLAYVPGGLLSIEVANSGLTLWALDGSRRAAGLGSRLKAASFNLSLDRRRLLLAGKAQAEGAWQILLAGVVPEAARSEPLFPPR